MFEYQADIRYNDFRKQIMTVGEVVDVWQKRLEDNDFFVGRRLSREQNSRFIESLLIGFPQPPIYIDSDNWYVFDGAERVKAYADYISGKFPLSSLYFKTNQYEGRFYEELSFLAKKNLLNTEIQVNVLNPGMSKIDRFGIYICIKPRIDADSLRACRRKIYGERYKAIEDLAREILKNTMDGFRRVPTIENEICHLLIGSTYKSYLNKSLTYNMDLMSNLFIEDGEFESFLKNNERRITSTLAFTLGLKASRLSIQMWRDRYYMDYYNAVIFHLGHEKVTESIFRDAYGKLGTSSRGVQTVDVFCRNIDTMIEEIGGMIC